ncbi:MAG: FG-GAP repeat domain-containing protein [Armatimonadota bacterium]
MTELIHAALAPQPTLGGYLTPPEIGDEVAQRSVARLTRVRLGHTSGTCNPALADVDGDGLDEIAVPFNRGEEDVVALLRGDGTVVWETTDAPFYHAVYDDDRLYERSHWHHRSRHRHLLTEIVDIDGDGALEVVVGLGPIHILDAATGALKRSLDLDGLAMIWTLANLRPGRPPVIVAAVDHHRERGSVVAVDGLGQILWQHGTVGRSFEDFMFAGDLTGDGVDEIAFSMADVGRFEVRDAAGELLWHKHVASEIGEDTHVDCALIGEFQPGGRQLVTSTGGCMFDAEGRLLWTLRERIEHGQHLLRLDPPSRVEPLIYLNSKTERYAWGVSPRGEIAWEQRNFSRRPDGRITLTSACDLISWSATGTTEIVQAEILIPERGHALPAEPGTPMTLYLTVLDARGREVAKLPCEEVLELGFNGPMCALAGHVSTRDRHDIVVLTHNSGELLIFSPP